MTFQNNEKKFYLQVRVECTKTYQQLGDKETKQFWSKICKRREHNRKAEWISNMEKELEGPKEGPKVKIHLDSLRATHTHKSTKLENARS